MLRRPTGRPTGTGFTARSLLGLVVKAAFRGACLAVVLLPALSAVAHETRPAYLQITQVSKQVYDFQFRQPQIDGRFLGLTVVTACEMIGEAQHRITTRALESRWQADCRDMALQDAGVGVAGLDRTLIDTLVHITLLNGDVLNDILTPREWRLLPSNQSGIDFVPTYFVVGMEHLLFGLDHVAFLLLLMYLIRDRKKLIIAVTSFTIAHSVTLGLSALDLIVVPQKPVEAVIALSILVLAWELTRPREDSMLNARPWLLTFIFGLMHGLGFAGAMAEIGLPEGSAIWALALFNLGIEAGQLLVICVVLLAGLLLNLLLRHTRLTATLPGWSQQVPVYVIGSLASYWLIDRTSGILFGI